MPEGEVAFHHHRILRGAPLLDAGEELCGIGPGQGHVGQTRRSAVKPDFAAIQCDRPFKVPVFKHPKCGEACFADVLPYGTVATGEDKRLLD